MKWLQEVSAQMTETEKFIFNYKNKCIEISTVFKLTLLKIQDCGKGQNGDPISNLIFLKITYLYCS